jgi:hypothetical protein
MNDELKALGETVAQVAIIIVALCALGATLFTAYSIIFAARM